MKCDGRAGRADLVAEELELDVAEVSMQRHRLKNTDVSTRGGCTRARARAGKDRGRTGEPEGGRWTEKRVYMGGAVSGDVGGTCERATWGGRGNLVDRGGMLVAG